MQAVVANVEDPKAPIEPRVIVTRRMVNIFTMQVCAVKSATDEEILAVCNDENPAGTSNGWAKVIRESEGADSISAGPNKVPVPCTDHEDRLHFLVLC